MTDAYGETVQPLPWPTQLVEEGQVARPTKDCPFCGETILASAIKCKHCAEFLDPSAAPKPAAPLHPTAPAPMSAPKPTYTGKRGNSPLVVCPHCGVAGGVDVNRIKQKKGLSGGKATAAVLTMGVSILATGLSRKEKVSEASCKNCRVTWVMG